MNISKQAIEAYQKAFEFYACDGHEKAVQMGLTAALEHIIPKESDHAMFSVFDTAYGERDTHAWQNRVFRGLTAVLSHLRGEGKAGVGTPPAIQEPNPDDVERVAKECCFGYHGYHEVTLGDHDWTQMHEAGKKMWRAVATAAIRAMKGQLFGVWAKQRDGRREEWVTLSHGIYNYTTDEKLLKHVVSYLSDGNDQWTYEVRPYTAPREESAEEIAVRELQDIADNGLRCDTNPTIQITTSANDTALRYVQYIRQIDSTMRDRAKSALEAIREAEKRGAAKCG